MSLLLFGGSEAPSHRNLLIEEGVTDFALSFIGLTRRVKNLEKWTISSKFPENSFVFLDSGAHSVNSGEEKFNVSDLEDLADRYEDYVTLNIDSLSLVSEFDALPLGKDWIETRREEFYSAFPDKFLPIWHDLWGVEYLQEMAEKFGRIGVTSTSLQGRNLAPVLNDLARNGIKLHAVGNTSVDDLYSIHWDSVSSLSWIGPQKNSETQIWTGKTFKRYTASQKDQARKRYRTYFANQGFDSEKIEAGDYHELLRLSIWSWQHLMSDINDKQGTKSQEVVTNPPNKVVELFPQTPSEVVATPDTDSVKSPATTRERETTLLPVFGQEFSQVKEINAEGEEETREVTTLKLRGTSSRVCKDCFLASRCPAFEADANCAFSMPVTLKTTQDRKQMYVSLLEMQAQRVAFMKFAEDQMGGYVDPNLSQELDRYTKMEAKLHEMEQDGFSLKIEAKGTSNGAQAGMLGRIFGDIASQRVHALEAPVNADQEIIEAEVIREMPDLDV